ncbi:hypothetical protein Agub_g2950 [Astrephomene gubernaculifera]|uniref:Uncharacterized protein n=1 Tax=Astrephomene gubernaculifera TaxID=47775 RepID=A0AAD3DJX3_9CHLO|nr:hypothetical protein Agub_g2950 [Astrephomene gubernaculifera]
MAKSKEPWYEYVLRNKAVRIFLSNYAEQDWQEITKLALLYGIIQLKAVDGRASIPLARLREIVGSGAAAVTVESALPDIKNKLEDLRAQLDHVAVDLHKPHHAKVPSKEPKQVAFVGQQRAPSPRPEQPEQALRAEAAAANVALKHAEKWLRIKGGGIAVAPQQMPAKVAANAVAAAAAQRAISPALRPPSEWRSGEPRRTYSPPGRKRSPPRPGDGLAGAQYPSWWGDGQQRRSRDDDRQQSPGPRSRSASRADHRRPPRLAYSVQLEPGQPIWQNDLVTSRYLDMPSSGYGEPWSPPPVPPQYLPPPDLSQPPQQGQQRQSLQRQHTAPKSPSASPPQSFRAQQPAYGGFSEPYGSSSSSGGAAVGGPGPQLYVVHPTGAMVPVTLAEAPRRLRQQQQPQQQEASGRPGSKPARPARAAVQSRIREQVEADKAAARARVAARQRATEAALALGARQQQQDRPRSAPSAPASIASRPSVSSPTAPAAAIADRVAANPYTSWFFNTAQDPSVAAAPPPPTQQQQPGAPPAAAMAAPAVAATSASRPASAGSPPGPKPEAPWGQVADWFAAATPPPSAPSAGAAVAAASVPSAPSASPAKPAAAPTAASAPSPPREVFSSRGAGWGHAATAQHPFSLAAPRPPSAPPSAPSAAGGGSGSNGGAQPAPAGGTAAPVAPAAPHSISPPPVAAAVYPNIHGGPSYVHEQHRGGSGSSPRYPHGPAYGPSDAPYGFGGGPRTAWAGDMRGGAAAAGLAWPGPSLPWESAARQSPTRQQQQQHQQMYQNPPQQEPEWMRPQQHLQPQQQYGGWTAGMLPPGAPAAGHGWEAPWGAGWLGGGGGGGARVGAAAGTGWTAAPNVQPPQQRSASNQRPTTPRAEALKAVRPEVVQWSKSWVGDFGHLDEPRSPPPSSQPPSEAPAAAAPPPLRRPSMDPDTAAAVQAGYQRVQQQRAEEEAFMRARAAAEATLLPPAAPAAASGPAVSANTSAEERQGGAAAAAAAAVVAAPRLSAGGLGGPGVVVAGGSALTSGWDGGSGLGAGLGVYGSGSGAAAAAASGATTTAAATAATAAAEADTEADRVWSRVLGQVARLTNAPEPEIGGGGGGGGWLGSAYPAVGQQPPQQRSGEAGGGGEGAAGSTRWDLDAIVGRSLGPSGLTYQ